MLLAGRRARHGADGPARSRYRSSTARTTSASVDPIDVDDLRLHGALDGVGQALDGRDRLLARTRHVALERDRLAEGDQHAAAECLADLEGQSDGNEGERDAPAGPGDLPPRLVVQRDPRGAGLDALDAALGVGGALRIDRKHAPVFERLSGRGERRRGAIGGPGRVLAPVHRDGAGAREQRAEQPDCGTGTRWRGSEPFSRGQPPRGGSRSGCWDGSRRGGPARSRARARRRGPQPRERGTRSRSAPGAAARRRDGPQARRAGSWLG